MPIIVLQFPGVLQCIAACCSLVQCGVIHFYPPFFQSFTLYWMVLLLIAAFGSVLQCVVLHHRAPFFQCVAVCCSVLQCVAVCCSVESIVPLVSVLERFIGIVQRMEDDVGEHHIVKHCNMFQHMQHKRMVLPSFLLIFVFIVLQCVAVDCSVVQWFAVCCAGAPNILLDLYFHRVEIWCSIMQCVVLALQILLLIDGLSHLCLYRVEVCCSVLQCAAVCRNRWLLDGSRFPLDLCLHLFTLIDRSTDIFEFGATTCSTPDSCQHEDDGECDEPSGLNNCDVGTDTSDCAGQWLTMSRSVFQYLVMSCKAQRHEELRWRHRYLSLCKLWHTSTRTHIRTSSWNIEA